MNIRFFMLASGQSSYSQRIEEELRGVFCDFMPEGSAPELFSSLDEAKDSLKRAFSDSHVLLFLVEPSKFASAKQTLSNALGFELYCNPTMLRKACDTAGISAGEETEFAYLHAFVPDKTRLFSTGDGLYTGFSVISGNQMIIFLPLERGRTDLLFSAQLIPYLNSAYHVKLSANGLKKYYADRLRTAVKEKNIMISLAGTNTAEFFKEYISFDSELDERIIISGKAHKRGAATPADHVVSLSIAAAEFAGLPYGVAISNAYYTGDDASGEKIVYVAVTNERETAVRKIHSVVGEDVAAFLTRCCSDVCAFICDVMENDADREKIFEDRVKTVKKRYIAAMIATVVLTVSVSVFGSIYFRSHDYSLEKWFDSTVSFLFPGSNIPVEDEVETYVELGTAAEGNIFDMISGQTV